MRLVLFQPDIPQNTGAILRLGACFGVPVDIIEPAGFVLDDRKLRRAGMDYALAHPPRRHLDWSAFRAWQVSTGAQLVALTTRGSIAHRNAAFRPTDMLLLGRESAGLPQDVLDRADARVRIPLRPGQRSLNVAQAAAIVVAEALRQCGAFAEIDQGETT